MRTLAIAGLVLALAVPAWAGEIDTDGDGLSDFQELHKYGTDPAKKDSDGDGTPDGAWDERREYAYTVRTVVRVMRPVDDSGFQDDFQDARVLEETDTWVKLEVVHYPLNTVADALAGDPDWPEKPPAKTHLAPGPTSNWDEAMRDALVEGLKRAGVDVDALDDRALVEKAVPWLLDRASYDGGQFTGYFTQFEDGKPSVHPGCTRGLEEYNRSGRTVEEQWAHDLFAKGMFETRSRGSCTSTAIYLNACLRALGIPTRIVYCIPVIDASDPGELAMLDGLRHPEVRRVLEDALGKLGSSWAGHTFNEVHVGGRWRRLNYAKLGQNTFGANVFGLLTHVFTVDDWADADVARTIGVRQSSDRRDDVFGHDNPYSTVELSDRFGVHAAIARTPKPADAWSTLTIEKAIWYDSPERPPNLTTRIPDPGRTGYVLLKVRECRPEGGLAQYRPFWEGVDRSFLLRAEGRDDVRAEATRGYWSSGWFFLEIPRSELERMAADVPYALVPRNGEGDMRWGVADGVRLTRRTATPKPRESGDGDAHVLDRLLWSDTPAGRELLHGAEEGTVWVLARIEAYDGDWDALTSYQKGGTGVFRLEAEGHPALTADMGVGGITTGHGEAWAMLHVQGSLQPGVRYRLRPPNARWVVKAELAPR